MKSKQLLMLYGMNPDIRLENALKRIEEYTINPTGWMLEHLLNLQRIASSEETLFAIG